MTPELWAVSIQGPDDLLAAADYTAAVALANRFNTWWAQHLASRVRTDDDPRMWATPSAWPYGAPLHAYHLGNFSTEYAHLAEPAEASTDIMSLTDGG